MPTEPVGRAETEIVYIGDHAARTVRRLLSQDLDKPRITAFAAALGEGAQMLEDTIFDLIVGRRLDAATGAALDQWGALVGEPRGGFSDTDYRKFIRARILVNICGGTPDEIITIFALVTDPVESVRYFDCFPACYTLQAIRKTWLTDTVRRRIRRMMEDVRPAGVGNELIEARVGAFGFDTDDEALGYDEGVFARVL